ncbi:D-alanyl-D-alanine carboxypeptidase family protein [Rhodoferax sediminis]|uniref:serine-type D-Ala-D-Ala carboxypeptidase n=1 Tax=Rhodoferax sediminis TaxID=2509614 RepID=A0A515DG54_9BURK|nr:D-alanyl-D-alanine carboxypeptidase family protein [Rhodoferax sediminis]QDL39392.1 D-alanyl-D-alanine carboxypeptidase [Rhodoferax sediminis]
MNRFTSALRALVAASLVAPLGLLAATPKTAPVPAAAAVAPEPSSLPQPPEIAARNYLVMDMTSNQILAQKDIDAPVEQASLTKLMTAYLVFDALRTKKITLTQTFPVSVRAWKMPGSRMFIDPKMQVPVDDLIKGMIVQSGNDAAMALAEGVGGTEEHFVQMMNDQAKALGMNSTTYKNPDGLTEPGHLTTARDLATLAMRLRRDFPEYAHYDAIKKYHYAGTPPSNDTNRNGLLFRDPTVDGLKTGHTDAAGYCLIATAKRDFPNVPGRRMLTVVLGTTSEAARLNESQKLLNWGYTAYEDIKLFGASQPAVTPSVWKGKENTLKLGRPEGIVVSVPVGGAGKIKTQVVRPDPLVAPFIKGQQVGTLKVSLGDQPLTYVPLVVLESVDQAGILGRAWDAIRLWIK